MNCKTLQKEYALYQEIELECSIAERQSGINHCSKISPNSNSLQGTEKPTLPRKKEG